MPVRRRIATDSTILIVYTNYELQSMPQSPFNKAPSFGVSRTSLGALVLASVLTAAFAPVRPAEAQLSSASTQASMVAPRVFMDCTSFVSCDMNHFQTEIRFVNWARDRADADVHVLVTGESVGGGGRRYTMEFIGLGEMEHLSDMLTYVASGTDVDLQTLDGLTRTLRLGLMRYAVQAGYGNDFNIAFTGAALPTAEDGETPVLPVATQTRDPWNYWTFRVGFSGNMSVTENRQEYRANPSLSADRVTEDWKVNLNLSANARREKITLANDRIVRNDQDNWSSSTLVVRSLGPRISTGFTTSAGSSVSNNTRIRMEIAPGIEWSYFPYTEASRRQLIAHYGVGLERSEYREETIFNETEETVPFHKLGIQYRAVAPWGNAGVGLDASQYLHKSGLYNVGASGNISLRIMRGLELSLSASGSKVRDQIYIPLAAISEEDILLGRQNLPTGYQYRASVGLNYRWGSTFSNIVNVRFPSSVR